MVAWQLEEVVCGGQVLSQSEGALDEGGRDALGIRLARLRTLQRGCTLCGPQAAPQQAPAVHHVEAKRQEDQACRCVSMVSQARTPQRPSEEQKTMQDSKGGLGAAVQGQPQSNTACECAAGGTGGATLKRQEDGKAPLVDAEDAIECSSEYEGGHEHFPGIEAAVACGDGRARPLVGGAQLGGDHPLLRSLEV